MADTKTAEERSKNMAAIRSKDTRPEVYFRKLLFSKGFRYRKNVKNVPGHPDLWLAKYNTAIFVNGCFWHRHSGCKYAYHPKSNVEYWEKKFAANIRRDRIVMDELSDNNIRQAVIWECTVKKMIKDPAYGNEIIERLIRFIKEDKGPSIEL